MRVYVCVCVCASVCVCVSVSVLMHMTFTCMCVLVNVSVDSTVQIGAGGASDINGSSSLLISANTTVLATGGTAGSNQPCILNLMTSTLLRYCFFEILHCS